MVRVLLVSPRVSVPPVTPMVRAPQVSHVSEVGVIGDADAEGVAGGVTVDGVGDVDGRWWCTWWFWVWVCPRTVIGLLWALLAGLLAGPGGVCRLLLLSVLGGFWPLLAKGAVGDVVGGGAAGVAMVSLVMTLVRVPQVGLGFG